MFGAKARTKIDSFIRPNGVYDIARSLHLILKLSGFFPVKIVETKTGLKPVICKFGVLCTIVHLLVYLTSVIHFVFLNNVKMSLNYGKIADYGYIAILVLQGITTLILFASVFPLIKFQIKIIKYTTQLENICHELKIDNSAVFLKSRYLIGIFIVFLTIFYIFGAGIFIHTQYVTMNGLPPIDVILIGILPNLYLLVKFTGFAIYVLALHVCNKEFYKFMEIYLI